jgi:hypothetical protein
MKRYYQLEEEADEPHAGTQGNLAGRRGTHSQASASAQRQHSNKFDVGAGNKAVRGREVGRQKGKGKWTQMNDRRDDGDGEFEARGEIVRVAELGMSSDSAGDDASQGEEADEEARAAQRFLAIRCLIAMRSRCACFP